jgi:glycosyltransferase involved in cell wall biosynthesis
MKVGIFIQNYLPDSGGVFTILETIKREMYQSQCNHEIIIFINSETENIKFVSKGITYINIYQPPKYYKFIIFRIVRKLLRLLGLINIFKLNYVPNFDKIASKENIELIWILGHVEFDLTIPFVYTVWDLGHRMLPCFPEVSKDGLWEQREHTFYKMITRATYVITGNEIGKKEILYNYPINPEKIKIIPFPISNFCVNNGKNINEKKSGNVKSPFIFYPAQFWPHKNHVSLIEVVAWLRDSKDIVINCYFVGSDKGNLKYIQDTIRRFRLENQVFILGFVDQEELIYLYKNALAMVYVSLMGPNNIPPLEALALGCPLIYSNIPGHLEQIGNSGIPVNAIDTLEIAEAILLLYNNPELRQKLITDGLFFSKNHQHLSYFKEMLAIIDNFDLYRKTWA